MQNFSNCSNNTWTQFNIYIPGFYLCVHFIWQWWIRYCFLVNILWSSYHLWIDLIRFFSFSSIPRFSLLNKHCLKHFACVHDRVINIFWSSNLLKNAFFASNLKVIHQNIMIGEFFLYNIRIYAKCHGKQ